MNERAEARISLKAIKQNALNIMSTMRADCKFMAVVKADAYGHGAVPVAKALYDIGVRNFAVATADEGTELRRNGIGGEILVLGKSSLCDRDKLTENDLCQCCDSFDYAAALVKDGLPKLHIKIDTGMSRLGFYCHDSKNADACVSEVKRIFGIPNVKIEGIFTHFAVADEDGEFTKRQFEAFTAVTDKLTAEGFNIGKRHCCNSAATLLYPQMHLDMVRQGIGIYGLERSVPGFPFTPAMTVAARIAKTAVLECGDTVSYGRSFKADKPLRRAVVSFGYADGMPRLLSGRYSVTVNGKQAPILGRICMDMFMIDVTDIDCDEGDEVVIFGADGRASEMADIIGTINYEIVCGISKRVPRVYADS